MCQQYQQCQSGSAILDGSGYNFQTHTAGMCARVDQGSPSLSKGVGWGCDTAGVNTQRSPLTGGVVLE